MQDILSSITDKFETKEQAIVALTACFHSIREMQGDLVLKDARIKYLESLQRRVNSSPELDICDAEIAKLQERSRGQELSFEDVKKFDLLVKNQKILEGQFIKVLKDTKPKVSDADLVLVVSGE